MEIGAGDATLVKELDGQLNTIISNRNGAKSGFEMCFGPSTLGV